MAPAPKRNEMFESASKVAASLLSKDNGPRIAVIESSGWDTHFAQRRRLKTLFSQLERGMIRSKADWDQAGQKRR